MADESANRRLEAVVFTDLEGYTAMVQQNEREALKAIDAHREVLYDQVPRHNGKIVQFYGDGSLSFHDSVLDAVNCAVELQKNYLSRTPAVPVRIGIHLGDIIFRQNSIFGDGVNVASRIQNLGIAGSILISRKVYEEIKNHPHLPTKFLFNAQLKNVLEPVGVYAIDLPFLKIPEVKASPSKALIPTRVKHTLRWLAYLSLLTLAIITAVLLRKNNSVTKRLENNRAAVDSIEKLAVLPFNNLTQIADLAEVSKMAAHWITSGLAAEPDLKILSYDAVGLLADGGLNNPETRQQFSTSTGTVKLIEGDYFKEGNQLIFKSSIRDALTGEYLWNFPEVRAPMDDVLQGIVKLENEIKGYLVSRMDNLLTPPNYEAYKSYLEAKDYWMADDGRALEALNKSIQLDSGFLNAYFLKLDYFYNTRQYAEAAQALEAMEKHFPTASLTERERNRFYYHIADVEGNNQKAFEYFMQEYEVDPTDISLNTDAAILALEYVNDPEKCLDILNQIPFDHLDFNQCTYCLNRLETGIRSYIALGKLAKAREVSAYVPARHNKLHLSQVQTRMYARTADTTALDALIQSIWPQVYDSVDLAYLVSWIPSEFALIGDHRQEIKYANIALKLVENAGPTLELAKTLQHLGQYQKADAMYLALAGNDKQNRYEIARSGVLKAIMGNPKAARDAITFLQQNRLPYDYGIMPYYQALIYAQLGEKEQTSAKLQEAIGEGRKFTLERFRYEPDFAPYYQSNDQ